MGLLAGGRVHSLYEQQRHMERGDGTGKVMGSGGRCGWMVESEWGKQDT